jgi:hypothetical protein
MGERHCRHADSDFCAICRSEMLLRDILIDRGMQGREPVNMPPDWGSYLQSARAQFSKQ